MVKKLFQSLLLGILIFAIALLVGYLSFRITYHFQVNKLKEQLPLAEMAATAAVSRNTAPLSEAEISKVDHYVARLENQDISIYTCFGGRESFLYTLDVPVKDLSKEDLALLTQGVLLKNRQALAAFEEDFTS